MRRISGYILGFKNLIAESIYPLASDKKEFRKIAELFLQNDGSFDDKAKNCLSDILANKKARGVLEMSCSLHCSILASKYDLSSPSIGSSCEWADKESRPKFKGKSYF